MTNFACMECIWGSGELYLRLFCLRSAYFLGKGFGWAFILNILLTLLGYIPGLIHAFWVQMRH